MDNRTGNLSEEDTLQPMIIDPIHNSTNDIVPFSQPDEDDQVVFALISQPDIPSAKDRNNSCLTGGTALRGLGLVPSVPVQVDDTGSVKPTSKQGRDAAQARAIAADIQFWTDFSADDFNRLSLDKLLDLPPLGVMHAYQLDINLNSLRSALTNV